jgi:hypothetical protein
MSNELTLPQRAEVALNSSQYEKDLLVLIDQSKDLVEVKDNAGRDQMHRAAMNLSSARISITKAAKVAREDATAFSQAIISEEKRLVAIVKPHEDRLFAARDIWDEKIEQEKQAKIAAERLRIENIRKVMDEIRDYPAMCAGKPIEYVKAALNGLLASTPKEEFFQEFLPEIISINETAKDKLANMIADLKQAEEDRLQEQQEREAEQLRLKLQAEENERVRIELAVKQKEIDDANRTEQLRLDEIARIADLRLAEQRREREAEELKHQQAIDKFNAEKAAFESEKQKSIDAQNAAQQAEANRLKYEQEQQEFIQALRPEIEKSINDEISGQNFNQETCEKVVNKLIENSMIDLLLNQEKCINGMTKTTILYLVQNSFAVSFEDAEKAIIELFTIKV